MSRRFSVSDFETNADRFAAYEELCDELEAELSAAQQKLEAAEARIKASLEQEPVAILHPYGDSGWLFLDEYCPPDRNPLKLYAAPVIMPNVMKLIRENAELTKLLAEAKHQGANEAIGNYMPDFSDITPQPRGSNE